jgi:hypothetical protein
MSVLAFSAGDAAYWALAIFLVAVGAGFLYAMLRLGRLFDGISSLIAGAERDALPVAVKAGQTVDRINWQLDKADAITDSAVDMAASADTAVRAVSHAIAAPVEKVSGLAAGLAHGLSSLRKTKSPGDAFQTAREAAARREHDLREEIRGHDSTAPTAERPEPTPPPEPVPRPEPVPHPDPVPRPAPAPEPPSETATLDLPPQEWSTLRPPKDDAQ